MGITFINPVLLYAPPYGKKQMKSAVIIEKYISEKNINGSLCWIKTDDVLMLDGNLYDSFGTAKEKCESFNKRNKEYTPLSENESWYHAKVMRFLDWDATALNMTREMILFTDSAGTGKCLQVLQKERPNEKKK